jgi:diguanylate cyclase
MGDLVLKQVAALLKASVKGHDTVARYGGEEFALIMPNTTLDDAFTVANKIRWTIASRDVFNRQANQSLGRVTISAGVSDFQAGESVEEWLERADRALYAAKHEGRNRVVAAAAKPIVRSAKFESGWSKRA